MGGVILFKGKLRPGDKIREKLSKIRTVNLDFRIDFGNQYLGKRLGYVINDNPDWVVKKIEAGRFKLDENTTNYLKQKLAFRRMKRNGAKFGSA